MKQNYNNPLFIFDGYDVDPEDIESVFNGQFKEEYPTAKEAVIFATAGGSVIYREAREDGSEGYICNAFKLVSFEIQSEGAVVFIFTYPDMDSGDEIPLYVEYTGDEGGPI